MNKLKVWLIRAIEPLPLKKGVKPMRMGMLAKYLTEKGHDVTWWANTFVHYTKEYLSDEYKEIQIAPNERIMLLHSPIAYKSHTSPARIIHERNLAQSFIKHCGDKEKPDIILCSWPTTWLVRAAINYGKEHRVPVVVDIRDLFPDIYYRAVPKFLQPLAKVAIYFLRKSAGRLLRQADGVTAVHPAAMEWGYNLAGRPAGKKYRAMFLCQEIPAISDEDLASNLKWWEEQGVTRDTWNMCCFAALGMHIDIDTLVLAVKQLAREHKNIRFIVGGEGDRKDYFMKLADGCEQILFPGFLNQNQMNSLMRISKLGVYCMKNLEDTTNVIGNKFSQSLSAGLPVLNSLTGYARTLLEQEHCGLTYREGDPEDCAAKILQLYNDEPGRQAMAANAYTLFLRQFEASKVNQQFEDYFYEIVSNFHRK